MFHVFDKPFEITKPYTLVIESLDNESTQTVTGLASYGAVCWFLRYTARLVHKHGAACNVFLNGHYIGGSEV